MHTQAMKMFLKLAAELDHPVAKLVAGAVEVGVVVPSNLKAALEKAGFFVEGKKLKVLYEIKVFTPWTKEEVETYAREKPLNDAARKQLGKEPLEELTDADKRHLVAQGTSDSPADALLQAVYAHLREVREELRSITKDKL